jgi:hypothetical protein
MKQLYLIYLYLTMARQAYWVNRKMMDGLVRELSRLSVLRQQMPREKIKRLRHYILLMQIVAGWVCALRGYGLTKQERRNVIYLGAITPLLDDLTDTLKINSSEVLESIKKKEDLSDDLKVVAYLYQQLMKNSENDFQQTFHVTLAVQDASVAQVEDRLLADDELRKITANKGGIATLLYRTALANPLKEGEAQAFTTLGYALQQVNDMFDIHKDFVNRQQTLYTRSTDLTVNKKEFLETLGSVNQQFLNMGYKPANTQKCLLLISLVTSRGLVCLDQLLRLQIAKGSFDVANFTREQLVCDMEKLSNISASFQYSVDVYHTTQPN